MEAERSRPWARTPAPELACRLFEVAESFFVRGDALAAETAERMGVPPAAVWFESIFPAVWGLLSTGSFLKPLEGSLGEIVASEPIPTEDFAGSPAVRLLPANSFQRLLLPGFSGVVLLRPSPGVSPKPASGEGLALCLLPFNLAGIGALDILHLLCRGPSRVLAKVSEKAPFLKEHLEKIFAPLVSREPCRLSKGTGHRFAVGGATRIRPGPLDRQCADGCRGAGDRGGGQGDLRAGRGDPGHRPSRSQTGPTAAAPGGAAGGFRSPGQQRAALRQLSGGAGPGFPAARHGPGLWPGRWHWCLGRAAWPGPIACWSMRGRRPGWRQWLRTPAVWEPR